MKIIKPFGPTLAKVKIPKNIINKINLEVDKIINSKKLTKKNVVALGGISKKNIKKLLLVNAHEFAGISFF